jgi:hypothetical protein
MWVASDDAILCFVAPAMILVATFGFISLGYRLTHGGLAAVSIEGWIGSAIVVAVFVGAWFPLARLVREGSRNPVAAALQPFNTKQAHT